MPIYAYRCDDCGFEKDVLQKFSDPVLTDCPQCHKPAFNRMVSAPTFQLKGTGWYVTDFRGGKPAGGEAAGGGGGSGGGGTGGNKDGGAGAVSSAPAAGATPAAGSTASTPPAAGGAAKSS